MSGDFLLSAVQDIKGIGPRRAKLLEKLGIVTVEDALFYLPFRYEDRSSLKNISDLAPDDRVTISGEIISATLFRRGKLQIFEITVSDGSAALKAKWFNQPFLRNALRKGRRVFLSGQVRTTPSFRTQFEIESPEYEFAGEGADSFIHTGRVVPVYRGISGLSQKTLRKVMYEVLRCAAARLDEFLPEAVLARNGLMSRDAALPAVHFPERNAANIDLLNSGSSEAHRRLAFEELFCFHLGIAKIRQALRERRGISFRGDHRLTEALLSRIPFRLTIAQKRVIGEIFEDMESPRPMNRLIQGDVGSGKTVVALMAMLRAIECGYQAALMAPTEILAQQHYFSVQRLLEGLGVRCELLTSHQGEVGEGDLFVGTHALIQEDVSFDKLGLAVIDEQHRFGVRQRALLRAKGLDADVLIMTATPIPRTLAMTLYGDMAYSCIDEVPSGRAAIETIVVHESEKAIVYELIAREVSQGGQAYVVYPIIEGDESIALKSAERGRASLGVMFPEFRIELVHGRMRTDERNRVMDQFRAGDIDVLVSTTVIEVGVDVPNSNVMVVVHAERFGLSQLHQLRGRVGRGKRKSFCVLLAYGNIKGDAERRLSVLSRTRDGFKIAEEDLAIRGPGDFFGTQQSGMPDLRVANLLRDGLLVEVTRREAENLLNESPRLDEYPKLRERVNRMWRKRRDYFQTY